MAAQSSHLVLFKKTTNHFIQVTSLGAQVSCGKGKVIGT